MKKFTYKFLIILLVAVMLPWTGLFHVRANQTIRVNINGQAVSWTNGTPTRTGGHIFVPFREFIQALGGYSGWHSVHSQASLFYNSRVIVLTADSRTARVDGRQVLTEAAPFMQNGHMLVPLRFVAETFGYEVIWNSALSTVSINTPGTTSTNGHANGANILGTGNLPRIPLPPPNGAGLIHLPLPSPTPLPEPSPEPSPSPQPTDESDMTEGHEVSELATYDDPAPPTELARDVSTAPITAQEHPGTTILTLLTPRELGVTSYVAQAVSAITNVTHFLLYGNRLVIDIHNAVSALTEPIYVNPAHPITQAATSQFSRFPEPNIVRLVFHLQGAVEYSVSLSADRLSLTVAFSKNNINTVALNTDSGADTLVIIGDTTPSVRYVMEPANRRLRIYIDNAMTEVMSGAVADSTFVERLEIENKDDGTVLIFAYIRADTILPGVGMLGAGDNSVAFMFYGRVEGVSYIPALRAVRICRAGGFDMDISQIQRFNEYLRGRYTIVFPQGASVPTLGIVHVEDGFICSFILARDVNGNVQLIFETERVLAFTVEETEAAYYIIARLPREVYSMVVVLDPGHGGNDPGVVRNGIRESTVVLAVTNKVAYLLSYHDYIGVYMTRHTDTNPSIFWRAEFADSFADMLVSVHVNGFTNSAVHGIETLYVVSGGETNSFTSRHLAEIIQRNKIAQTGAHNRGLFNRPGLVVIRQAYTIPAVLSEMGFATNPQEAARMLTAEFQWQVARGLYYGIMEAHGTIGR